MPAKAGLDLWSDRKQNNAKLNRPTAPDAVVSTVLGYRVSRVFYDRAGDGAGDSTGFASKGHKKVRLDLWGDRKQNNAKLNRPTGPDA